jgi:ketosteroid isomerase-like protein
MRLALFIAISIFIVGTASGHPLKGVAPGSSSGLAAAARPAARVADAFQAALERGDAARAAALLADDAVIYEEGGAERSKAEYAAEHLPADAEFSKNVRTELRRRTGSAGGGFAWVASEGAMVGTFNGKPVNRRTTETMVLRHGESGWKIVHIHWSSADYGGVD